MPSRECRIGSPLADSTSVVTTGLIASFSVATLGRRENTRRRCAGDVADTARGRAWVSHLQLAARCDMQNVEVLRRQFKCGVRLENASAECHVAQSNLALPLDCVDDFVSVSVVTCCVVTDSIAQHTVHTGALK